MDRNKRRIAQFLFDGHVNCNSREMLELNEIGALSFYTFRRQDAVATIRDTLSDYRFNFYFAFDQLRVGTIGVEDAACGASYA